MNLEKGLYAYLVGIAAITDITSTRIWPVLGPQKTASGDTQYPSITYEEVSLDPDHTHDGPSGLAVQIIRFYCWAETFEAARNLAIILRQNLDGKSGTWSYTGGSVAVQGVFWQDERAAYDEEARVYAHELEFVFWHAQS